MDKLIRFFEKAVKIDADPNMTRDRKDVLLAGLMTDMERIFEIPMFRDEQWERDNHCVISTYREISNMRKL